MSSEPVGCLGILLKLFGVNLPGVDADDDASAATGFPYRLRDDFLSPAEFSFYKVLCTAVGDRFTICPKVSLNDLFYVSRPHENKGARNRINRKHVDFVLCDPQAMQPVCGVELDDSSHSKKKRIERDQFVDGVFAAAELPILHVKAERAYAVNDLREVVSNAIDKMPLRQEPPPVRLPTDSSVPVCPKCDRELVQRTASKGSRKGKVFWGCPNYPKCRHTQEAG